MAENELEIHRDFALYSGFSECVFHGVESAFTCQSAGSRLQGVARANGGQIPKQRIAALVLHGQSIDIQNRIAKTCIYEAIAEVVHVEKAINMMVFIHFRPGPSNFLQAVWAKGREGK